MKHSLMNNNMMIWSNKLWKVKVLKNTYTKQDNILTKNNELKSIDNFNQLFGIKLVYIKNINLKLL